MEAVVLRSPRVLELRDIPLPKLLEPNHVLIKVGACGICGSDLRYWAGENPWAMHTLGRHVDNLPNIVLGHEFAGTVVAVNSPEFEPLLGRRVGVQPYRVCGRCKVCRSGRHNLCKQTIHVGHGQGWGEMEYFPGAYAEYCLAWGDLLYPLPDDVSFEDAAMADILGVAVHVAGRAALYDGADVLCIGGGPAGLSVALVAKARGARTAYIAEPSEMARGILARYDVVVTDPLDGHADLPPVAAVFDSVGTNQTMCAALPLLEESGTYVNMAVHSTPVEFNALQVGSERTITTSSNGLYEDVAAAYELIFSRKVDVTPMISHCFPLCEFRHAFDLLLSVPKQAYKVVFTP